MKTRKTITNETKQSSALIPNAFQVPNIFIDKYCRLLTPEENLCLFYACRHILGWHDKIHERRRRMSLSFFENGFGKFGGCGLCRRSIITALSGLATFGFLIKVGEPNIDGQEWEIVSDENQIDLDGLVERHGKNKSRNQERTVRGRMIQKSTKSVNLTGESDSPTVVNGTHQVSGESDSPTAVNGTHQHRLVGLTKAGESDSHNQNQYSKPTLKPNKNGGEAPPLSFPKFWLMLEPVKKWWDESATQAYQRKYSWHPGDLVTGLGLEELLRQAEKFGMEVLAAKYEDFLRQDKKFFAENNHPLSLFIKCIGQFSGERKEVVTLDDENARQYRDYMAIVERRNNGHEKQIQVV